MDKKVCINFSAEMVQWIEIEQAKTMSSFGNVVRQAIYQAMTGTGKTDIPAEPKRGPGRPPKEKPPEPEPIVGYQSVEEVREALLSILTDKGPTGEKVSDKDILKADPRLKVTDMKVWARAQDALYKERKIGMGGYPDSYLYLKFEESYPPTTVKGWAAVILKCCKEVENRRKNPDIRTLQTDYGEIMTTLQQNGMFPDVQQYLVAQNLIIVEKIGDNEIWWPTKPTEA